MQEILVALSFALDATEGAVAGHATRSCLLAVRLGLGLDLDAATISDLYFGTLLKDAGRSSNAARMCEIVGGNDRMSKAGAKLVNRAQPQRFPLSTLKLLWHEAVPASSFLEKSGRRVAIGTTQPEKNRELIEMRCDRGAAIVRKLGFSDRVAMGVRHLDEHWDGGGHPQGLTGQNLPLLSRVMKVAQHLDIFCMDRGPVAALHALQERSGRWFDPEIVTVACSLGNAGSLWCECLPEDSLEATRQAALNLQLHTNEHFSAPDIDSICEAFADVVDAKSPFTFRHSLGVMDASVAIGKTLGLSANRLQVLRRAALLHDIGKLGISNRILDKPTQLTDAESAQIKKHPGLGAQILSRIGGFGEIAMLVGEHHERLNGSGYPYKLCAQNLSIESRVLAVADIYAALSEQRPYREALDSAQILTIMDAEVPTKLDFDCYAALRCAMEGLTVRKPTPTYTAFDMRRTPTFQVAELGFVGHA